MNVAIVQARLDSSRLPGKALMPVIGQTTVIEYLMRRVERARYIDKLVLATSDEKSDDELASHALDRGMEVFRGDKYDVLKRFYDCAKHYGARTVIRLTGDNPLIDPLLVDECMTRYMYQRCDFLANTLVPTYPDGQDIAIFSMNALTQAHEESASAHEREHVTPWMRRSQKLKKESVIYGRDMSDYRMTVDYEEDIQRIKLILREVGKNSNQFTWLEACREIDKINIPLNQHVGSKNSQRGQELWRKAKTLIPGGNMLLSKRAEMFLPELWPSYFQSSYGCRIRDLGGIEYIDMSIMGIGTNILGYNNCYVDNAVRLAVSRGNSSTLNCPEEVFLAERLIEMHPWADMVRFARTGGEANAIAIRIARSATQKQKVIFCGYHGWHDWYLAVNLCDSNGLNGHLLPGLSPNGVAKGLKGSVEAFVYNDVDSLRRIFTESNDVAAIIMEVKRNIDPKEGFLQEVRSLCDKNGAVLIFDECTSGFRESFGGLHLNYGVNPDMAMFGKAIGNGYALTAVIGRESVMEEAQKSFISSTFWTERIGPSAALAALDEMERVESWKRITNTGRVIQSGLRDIGAELHLNLEVFGLPSLTKFRLHGRNNQICKTFITQEMLTRGYLAANSIYVSTAHDQDVIAGYLKEIRDVLGMIRNSGDDELLSRLKGPICHVDFQRIN